MTMGKLLILLGLGLVLLGLLLHYLPGAFTWFGHLPGDIRTKNEHTAFFFPVTSMLLISVIVSIIINVFFRR